MKNFKLPVPVIVALSSMVALLLGVGFCSKRDADRVTIVDNLLTIAAKEGVTQEQLKDRLTALEVGDVWIDPKTKAVTGFTIERSSFDAQKTIWNLKFKDSKFSSFSRHNWQGYL